MELHHIRLSIAVYRYVLSNMCFNSCHSWRGITEVPRCGLQTCCT